MLKHYVFQEFFGFGFNIYFEDIYFSFFVWFHNFLVQVIHRSEERRMVLLLDIHHPDLSEDRRRLWRQRMRVTSWGESGPAYEVSYEDEAGVTEDGKRGREEL